MVNIIFENVKIIFFFIKMQALTIKKIKRVKNPSIRLKSNKRRTNNRQDAYSYK